MFSSETYIVINFGIDQFDEWFHDQSQSTNQQDLY